MNSSYTHQTGKYLVVLLFAGLFFASAPTVSQSSGIAIGQHSENENSKPRPPAQNSPPTFTPSGAHGTTAPSGYSTGLSNQETAHVKASANALQPTIFAALTNDAQLDCGRESVLLHDLENSPHDFAPNHALGIFYLSHGDYFKAIQYLDTARSLVPGNIINSRELAVAMIGAGHNSDAVALLEQLLREHGSDSTLLRLLAFAYAVAGENEKSTAEFHNAAASDPGDDNQYDCGIGFIQLGALKQALALFTRATKIHPESARLWLGLGIAQHLLGSKQEAIAALLRSAEADPDFLPPLATLAELSSLSDQTKADLRRRIATFLVAHPDNSEAHFAYALVLSKSQTDENGSSRPEIVSQLKSALEVNPQMARAHFLLADIETQANNLPGAIDELVGGLKLEPGNARAHYRLSMLYFRTGQQENARREMSAFRSLHGNATDQDRADESGTFPVAMLPTPPAPARRDCGAQSK